MNYSIDTINPCGEMSDKDIKNQKIVDLASPIDHQDEANKKYADKKETINLFTFFVKIWKQKSLYWDIHQEKATSHRPQLKQ